MWKPKTRQSYGKVHIRDDARKTMERLAQAATYLLLPNDAAVHGGIKPAWKAGEATEARLKLWRMKS